MERIELSRIWKRAGLPEYLLLGLLVGALGHWLVYGIVVDDAFISYRYAENYADRRGLVFNVGERVDRYTNFLWVMILAAYHKLGLSTVSASVPLGLAAYLLTILVVYKGGRSFGLDKWMALIALLNLASSASAARWASAGMDAHDSFTSGPFFCVVIRC